MPENGSKRESRYISSSWLLGLLTTCLIGSIVYGVNKVEKLSEFAESNLAWQAKIETTLQYEKASYDDFVKTLDQVSADMREMKNTQVKTWDKVLELDERLRKLEQKVDEMSRVVYANRRTQ